MKRSLSSYRCMFSTVNVKHIAKRYALAKNLNKKEEGTGGKGLVEGGGGSMVIIYKF